MLHPDDEPGFGGYDVYGVLCSTYEEACILAGIDTPAQAEAEARYWAERELIESLRQPAFHRYCDCIPQELPF